jgi:hypothetical protein
VFTPLICFIRITPVFTPLICFIRITPVFTPLICFILSQFLQVFDWHCCSEGDVFFVFHYISKTCISRRSDFWSQWSDDLLITVHTTCINPFPNKFMLTK